MNSHHHYMGLAFKLAERAAELGEVPVGALVVHNHRIVAQAHNRKESDHNPLAHAEILAIQETARRLKRWRLSDCTLYVTLEPCAMCAGALVQARFQHLVFATPDPKAGAAGSLMNICQDPRLNHRLDVVPGIMAEECATQLSSFFRLRREEKRMALR